MSSEIIHSSAWMNEWVNGQMVTQPTSRTRWRGGDGRMENFSQRYSSMFYQSVFLMLSMICKLRMIRPASSWWIDQYLISFLCPQEFDKMLLSHSERVHYDNQPVYRTNLIIIRFLEWSDYSSGRVKSMMWYYPIYHNQMTYMIMKNLNKTHRFLHNTQMSSCNH